MQERIERSVTGRVAVSLLVCVLLASMAAANLPASHLRETVAPATGRILAATGLEQRWSIFAPHPRTESIAVEARVEFRDGGESVWRPPAGGPLVDAYWDYRWRKLAEIAIADPRAAGLRPGLAAFAARQVAAPGREPVVVTLWAITRQPGERPRARAFFRVPVRLV